MPRDALQALWTLLVGGGRWAVPLLWDAPQGPHWGRYREKPQEQVHPGHWTGPILLH